MNAQDAAHTLLTLAEDELGRIILDIHDGPVQYLYSALSLLTSMQQDGALLAAAPELKPRLAQIGMLLESSLYEVRFFMGAMRPPEFRSKSLTAIIEALAIQHEERTGNVVHLICEATTWEVALPVKIALYRILQEALSNSYRHAGVTEHFVRLWHEAEQIKLEVYDEGCGFDPGRVANPPASQVVNNGAHLGLHGMTERAKLIGGQLCLQSQPGQGTHILVTVPQIVTVPQAGV